MNVCVGIPSYGGLDIDVVISLMNNVIELSKYHHVNIITDKNYPVDHSRNLIVKTAQKSDCDVLLFFDSDIVVVDDGFNRIGDGFKRLVDAVKNHKVVSGIYYLKTLTLNLFDIEEKDNFPYLSFYKQPVEYVDGAGMGLIAIDMDVFNTISYPWFKWIIDHPVGIIGEDVYFSWMLKKQGIRIRVEKTVWGLHQAKGWIGKDALITITR